MRKYYKPTKNTTKNSGSGNGSGSSSTDPVFPDTLNTYIGQKGYTIQKSELSKEQLDFLTEKLTIKPNMMGGGSVFAAQNQPTYPVYRESTKKLYIPRFFGEKIVGKANEFQLSNGDDISVEFNGTLRENQVPVVETYLKHVGGRSRGRGDRGGVDECGGMDECSGEGNGGGGLLELPCAFGKTSLSLYIISQLKKKALVIVHKEFLLNQWVERIGQFLPTARVGRIQGSVIDIENKDIVIAMLQSISMKEYPADTFQSFGLTVIDEVHHISSEVFSRALFKIVTKYMLGLSATMERKDGTTHVFKMFLGDIVYKGTRDEEHPVIVRGIEFKTNDSDFNEVEYDFRGNPQYSKMISKLCDYNPRSEFILKVVERMIQENPKAQIMVIGHNRSLLTYLHDAIESRQIASVGYYVGGMKEEDLKESESKQIVVATYGMAAEGLDIKTLSSLIMVTPKTDIVQTVGRILRMRHSQPIIVDIIDSHELFQNQWKQRVTYYRKCNYTVRKTSSPIFISMGTQVDWSTEKSWKVVNLPKVKVDNGKSDKSDKCIGNGGNGTGKVDIKTTAIGKCLLNIGNIDFTSLDDMI
jgi:superfamily II DNA or RNA helicase